MIILIPSYEPDRKLVNLVESLCAAPGSHRVLVVNDGSGSRFDAVFDKVRFHGASVIEHRPNRGKGYALKSGFAYIAEYFPDEDVVCADSDGQHLLDDILSISAAVSDGGEGIVLGVRGFEGGVPLRSRFGNTATRVALRLVSGLKLQDTQTGLRGYPAEMLPWLVTIAGDRFEYELNVLLEAKRSGIEATQIPISTVYIEDNASSHFRPIADSARVYLPLVKFGASSFASAALDFALVLALMAATGNLALAVVGARVTSAGLNYTLNRQLVFDRSGLTSIRATLAGYASLAVGLVIASYLLLHWLHESLGMALAPAKVMSDVVLFFASYHVQRRFIFTHRRRQVARSESAVRL